jgi:hypothetical protein
MIRKSWRWVLVVAVVLTLTVGVAAQLAYVHSETGYWGLSVSGAEAPSRVQYDGRYYDQGEQVKVPYDAVRRGHTDRGATVFKPAGDENTPSVIIYVSTRDRAWEYGLVGGP